jgi:hypothetical protein
VLLVSQTIISSIGDFKENETVICTFLKPASTADMLWSTLPMMIHNHGISPSRAHMQLRLSIPLTAFTPRFHDTYIACASARCPDFSRYMAHTLSSNHVNPMPGIVQHSRRLYCNCTVWNSMQKDPFVLRIMPCFLFNP